MFQETVSPWRFSSKRVDEETGWVYFGRRYYAPSWGRWTTADPAWFADGPNLYAYVHNNPLKYVDPDGLSAIEHQQMNRPGTQGTFFGSFSRGILDDTSWGASSWMLGDYVCDNWQSSLGYGMGTGVSMMAGLVYGGTEAKLLGAAGKGVNRAARWLNFAEKEVKAACKMEGTAAKISREIAPKIERSVKDVVSNGGNGNYQALSSKSGADLNRHLRNIESYGKAETKELWDGRIRYYGDIFKCCVWNP